MAQLANYFGQLFGHRVDVGLERVKGPLIVVFHALRQVGIGHGAQHLTDFGHAAIEVETRLLIPPASALSSGSGNSTPT